MDFDSNKKVLKVFTNNGISTIKASKIMHELGEALSDYTDKGVIFMEIDSNGIIDQFFDMLAEKSFDRIINNSDMTEKQAESVKKVLKVFTDNGISTIKALKIIHELGEVLSDYDKKTTVYVCNHCGKKFDKTYPNIESILCYHLETEHAGEVKDVLYFDSSDVIENNFKEE